MESFMIPYLGICILGGAIIIFLGLGRVADAIIALARK